VYSVTSSYAGQWKLFTANPRVSGSILPYLSELLSCRLVLWFYRVGHHFLVIPKHSVTQIQVVFPARVALQRR
jgi:hypothetical protein